MANYVTDSLNSEAFSFLWKMGIEKLQGSPGKKRKLTVGYH